MALFACGINHKTAPIAIREQMFFTPTQVCEPLSDLKNQEITREAVVLSTCNRTEFYFEAPNETALITWLRQRLPQANDVIAALYCHQEMAAVRHIMRVACGLDSMVLGEPQILGQLKQAFAAAQHVGTIGPQLQRLFQYIFATTKQVRTHTGIGTNAVSMTYIAIELAKNIFPDLSKVTAMVIGTGEMTELALRYLRNHNVAQLYVVNRTHSKATTLAQKYSGKALIFADLLTHLPQADIIITATSAPLPILGKGSFERAIKIRKHRPIFVVDLAVPRDVEPEVAELNDIYLYCVDDLEKIITANLHNRQHAAEMAEKLVELQADHFMRWLRSLDCVSIIRDYRNRMEHYRDKEVEKALKLLYVGQAPEQVVVNMARNLINKTMHIPTIQMRQAGYEGQLEKLALARQLFALDTEK